MFLPELNPNEEWLGVVIAVPEPWASVIAEARVKVGDHSARKITPHITLLPPVAVARERLEQVYAHLQAVAEKFSPFYVELCGTGSFEPVSPVTFLSVREGFEACCKLAAAINSDPLDFPPRFPYHPHVTLAQDLPDAKLQQAQELGRECRASWLVSGFRLDRVDADGNYNSMALFNFI